jgi:hypothetical protein
VRLFALVALLSGACGRLDFGDLTDGNNPIHDATTSTGGGSDAATMAAAPVYRGAVASNLTASGSGVEFQGAIAQAGDLVLFQLTCNDIPGTPTISAPGWTFSDAATAEHSGVKDEGVASVQAVAPAAGEVNFTITASCTLTAEGVEFTNATVDVGANLIGTNACSTSLTTTQANDTIWFACIGATGAATPGYTLIDTQSEYRQTTDPASTDEQLVMSGGGYSFMTAIALAPR